MQVLGVRFDEVSHDQAIERVRVFLTNNKQNTVFTPNPEMCVDAVRDTDFRDILNRGSLNICDGTGVAMVSGGKLKRLAGSDFVLDICREAENLGKSVYLLGSEDERILLKAKEVLMQKFPKLRIVGWNTGISMKSRRARSGSTAVEIKELVSEARTDAFQKANDKVVDDIIFKAPDVLFVAFGHKKQEWWIDVFQGELSSVALAMGVGGTFDVLGGKVSRAPVFFRRFGIEWMWRLIVQPWRIRRIWKATAVFLWFVFHRPKHTDTTDQTDSHGSV